MSERVRRVIGIMLVAVASCSVTLTQATSGRQTLEGQIVCELCWGEAPRPEVPYGGEADLACAARCAADGAGQVLAVAGEAGFTLYHLRGGAYEPGEKGFLPLVTRFARVEGSVDERGDEVTLLVDRLEIIDEPPGFRSEIANDAMPILEAVDLAGVSQSLAGLRGRIVVLNFWATWCQPCVEEMPRLVEVQREYGLFGLQVVGASADSLEFRAHVLKKARELDVNFPVWLGATTENMQRFGLPGSLPGTVILDRDGRVRARHAGIVSKQWLKQQIEPLLQAPHLPAARAAATGGKPARTEEIVETATLKPATREAATVPS
ncbi:MAG: TlpA family protein disulfide reductase [Acidobacteriota bacterium]|nr:MAG: TlpA family protein disulfide reductase [Acidobacteriota bacterium]